MEEEKFELTKEEFSELQNMAGELLRASSNLYLVADGLSTRTDDNDESGEAVFLIADYVKARATRLGQITKYC